MATQEFLFACSICGKNVDITTCKTDEFGRPVHSFCYATKIARQNKLPPRPTSKQSRPPKVA